MKGGNLRDPDMCEINLSVGFATAKSTEGRSLDDLVRAADQMMNVRRVGKKSV